MTVRKLLRNPSAFLPLTMSGAALALIVVYIIMFGVDAQDPQGDEGAPARLFQLLMAAQLLIMAYFGIKWLPRDPEPAARVLGLQILAAVVPVATIILLGW